MRAAAEFDFAALRLRGGLPARDDTPGWIRFLAIPAVVLAVVTAIVTAADARSARGGIEVIGGHTAPTVAATEDLSFAIADMDAQLAYIVLAGSDPALAAVRDTAVRGYEQRRIQADADLQQAMTIADTDGAVQQIREILDRFGTYEARAADTRQLDEIDQGGAGSPSARTLADFRTATDLIPDLLSRAQQLADTNSAVLERSYHGSVHAATTARIHLALLAAALLATLIGLQILLRVRTRRRINPALLAATLLAAVGTAGGILTNSIAVQQLTVAKPQAFDSLLALRQARAVGYDANADESRYLLDPQRRAGYETAFFAESQQLAALPVSGIDDYDAALNTAIASQTHSGAADPANAPSIGADSFLGKELRNITFEGERAAVTRTLLAYQTYQLDDRRLRATTDPAAAIAYCTGPSDQHFTAYDQALVATIDINQHAFAAAVAEAERAYSGWTGALPAGGAVVLVLLVLLGVRPRLAEYR
ncbi:hypothetical protein [Nocardia aurantia]|uniref:Uncharacterized protein n=1 Tax=Nocardia aurantia TaxID=2585199 RepID=A0A7K0DSY4_9NOCA|nr:hypothetical protein [Nocardia aurantia]MQY28885.1 hypothetical protein [Nocardia aurantia]